MHGIDDQLRELLPRLRRFALSLTRNPASADDLVQASLEKALGAWAGKQPGGDLRAWLFAIVYRQFLDTQRSAKRYRRLLELFSGGQAEHHAPSAERAVVAQTTLAAFERLPHEQRALLLWASVEGLRYQEIAEILRVPIGTVMSRLARARQALRQLSEGEIATPALRVLK